jgi:hypothetical protein
MIAMFQFKPLYRPPCNLREHILIANTETDQRRCLVDDMYFLDRRA